MGYFSPMYITVVPCENLSMNRKPSSTKTKSSGAKSTGGGVLLSVKTKPQAVYVAIGGKTVESRSLDGKADTQAAAESPRIVVLRKPSKTKVLKSADATRRDAREFLKRAGILGEDGQLRDVLLSS